MSNWYKPHLKSAYNAQDKTFVSRLNRLRFFHDRRVLKFLRWKKGDLGRRLRGVHSLRWYKLRYRFGLKFYNFSSKKRRKLRAFRQSNMYKVGLDRKKNFLSFYRKFDESKIRVWFKEYYNKSRQYKVLNFFRLFETRLDVLCFRMKLLPTIFLANTFIKNSGILINYALVKEPGKRVATGDLISFEDPVQWSFFSSRFTEQLWKRWHRFKELNVQRKKTRLLVFREYYKKHFNSTNIDKKKQNSSLFSNLENNWVFMINAKKDKYETKKNYKNDLITFNKTFWALDFFIKRKTFNKLDAYLNLINGLLKLKTKLSLSKKKKKVIVMLLTKYLTSKNVKAFKSHSFLSLVQFYKHRFSPFFTKKLRLKNRSLEDNFALKSFVQELKIANSNFSSNKNFIALKSLYYTLPFRLINLHPIRKNGINRTKIGLFLSNHKKKVKSLSNPSLKGKLFNQIKESSLTSKMNFWSSNLLPFLKFNLNLKNLIEVIFLQHFSIKSSFNFFFLKFWLTYRKFILSLSKIFSPLTNFFNYLKVFKNLISQNKKLKKNSLNWFLKGLYSRFFVQKLNILANLKNIFKMDFKILNSFFKIVKTFINPSVFFINKNLIDQSFYRGLLILERCSLTEEENAVVLFNQFNNILASNVLIKISFKLLSKKKAYKHFTFFFNKYDKKNNKAKLGEYLKFLYAIVAKNLNESFLLDQFLNSNNIDYKDNFLEKKNINRLQNKFVDLSLQRAINQLNVSKTTFTRSDDLFNNLNFGFTIARKEFKGYIHSIAQSQLVKNARLKKKSKGRIKLFPNKWLSSTNRNNNNFLLTRNIRKQNTQNLLDWKPSFFNKKRIIWRNSSILPNFKRYKRKWKSRNWSKDQLSHLKNLVIKKKMRKYFVDNYKDNLYNFSKMEDIPLDKIRNNYYLRKIAKGSRNLNFLDYVKNERLLQQKRPAPYTLHENFLRKVSKASFLKLKKFFFWDYIFSSYSLELIYSKMKTLNYTSNKTSFLDFLKNQLTLWKRNFITFITRLDLRSRQQIKGGNFIIRIRRLIKSIKQFLVLTKKNLNNSKFIYFIKRSLNSTLEAIRLVKSINSRIFFLKNANFNQVKDKRPLQKTWLKFRLRLKRSTKNNLFKRQFFKRKLFHKQTFSFEDQKMNKSLVLKNKITRKTFRKTWIFKRRSKRRRKSYKLGQKKHERWLKKRRKRYCDINLTKWKKLQAFSNKQKFDKEVWFQLERWSLKDSFIKQLAQSFSTTCLFEKFILLEIVNKKYSSLATDSLVKSKNTYLLKNIHLDKSSQKRNELLLTYKNKKKSYLLDVIKVKRKKNLLNSINNEPFDRYKNNYNFLFKLNSLRRYKSLVNYHQRWNKNSTTRIRYQMRTKLLSLNKIRQVRKKRFFNIRSKPLLLLPHFLEFDFVTFRSYVLSTPNLEASLYGGATNSYFYSFLSFYQRLGL